MNAPRNLDKGACVSIFESLCLFHANIEKVSRHGKPRSDGKRILKVQLSTEKMKHNILKMSKQLRRSQKYSDVYINPDLTPAQQHEQYNLRKELKEQRALGADVVIHKGEVVDRKLLLQDFHH